MLHYRLGKTSADPHRGFRVFDVYWSASFHPSALIVVSGFAHSSLIFVTQLRRLSVLSRVTVLSVFGETLYCLVDWIWRSLRLLEPQRSLLAFVILRLYIRLVGPRCRHLLAFLWVLVSSVI